MSLQSKLKDALDKRISLRNQIKNSSGHEREELMKRNKKLTHNIKKIRRRLALTPDWNGCPPVKDKNVRKFIVRANRKGLYLTATTNGTHATTSWHYVGLAADVAAAMTSAGVGTMVGFQRAEAQRGWENYNELFGPDSFYLKNGQYVNGAFPDHGDHVHGAPIG